MSGPAVVIQIPLPSAGDAANIQWTSLREAIRWAGEHLRERWIDCANNTIERATGDYVNGLSDASSVRWPYDSDELAVGTFNTAKHAAAIEEGYAAFHLPERIEWGTGKTKYGKNGWYLLIPFSHTGPPKPGKGNSVASIKASMPESVHALASKMKPGERLTLSPARLHQDIKEMRHGKGGPIIGFRGTGPGGGRYVTPANESTRREMTARNRVISIGNGQTATTHPGPLPSPASRYAAGEHALTHGQAIPDLTRKAPSIYEGLFRSGAPGHGQYTTIRAITPNSPGWWIPGQPGRYIARRVAEENAAEVRDAISAAFKADVERTISHALTGGI